MKGKITDAGSGGAEDGFCADQLVDLPPHLPLELEHLGHALLDVLGPGDTLCQAGSPTRKNVEKGEIKTEASRIKHIIAKTTEL